MRAEVAAAVDLRRRTIGMALLPVLLAAVLGLAAAPAQAGQTRLVEGDFCEPTGLGARPCSPTFSQPIAAVVDPDSGDLLVAEGGGAGQRIARYHEDGTPAPFGGLGTHFIDGKPGPGGEPCAAEPASCDATPQNGLSMTGGQNFTQIAIDRSGGETDGNIYLTQNGAAGSSVNLIDVFDAAGEYAGQVTGAGGTLFGEGFFGACGVAVDPDGNLFVSDADRDEIYKYEPGGAVPVDGDHVATFESPEPCRLAAGAGPSAGGLFVAGGDDESRVAKLDAGSGEEKYLIEIERGTNSTNAGQLSVDPVSGHLLVFGEASGSRQIEEFEVVGDLEANRLTSFTTLSPPNISIGALAVNGDSGRVYVRASSNLRIFGPLVALPDVSTGPASNIGETTATVGGTVQANGVLLSECSFEYGPTSAYGSSVPCAESPAEIGVGAKAVHADLSGLAAETTYHFRLVAANANGPANPQGADASLRTVSKPEIVAAWPEEVLYEEATLRARINPHSAATTYRFEWGPAGAPYAHSTAEIPIGSAATAQEATLRVDGLSAGAAYHFRVVASNHCLPESSPATVCVSEGADRGFATYRRLVANTACENRALRDGPAALLPDCRAYEMVSPPDKNGGDIVNESSSEAVHDAYIRSAPGGGRITYSAGAAFAGQPAAKVFNQYLAAREETAPGEGGWVNQGINAPLGDAVKLFNKVPYNESGSFAEDLCSSFVADFNVAPLTPQGQEGYVNLYRRQNCEPGEGGFEAITTAPPPAGAPLNYPVPGGGVQEVVHGTSADQSAAVFVGRAALPTKPGTPGAAAAGSRRQIYLHLAGDPELRLVSVLPGGAAYAGGATAVGAAFDGEGNLRRAMSADGRRVFWTAGIDANTLQGALYVRENPAEPETGEASGARTIAVSAGSQATFWDASVDGSEALYTEVSPFGGLDLYRFDVTTQARTKIAAGVLGLAGASEDLERVYFASTQALPGAGESHGEEAVAGQPNLYLAEGGGFSFIATLAPGDADVDKGATASGDRSYSVITRLPFFRASRVSADGRHIAFHAQAAPTGFDNAAAQGGEPALEVFTYEAGGELLCVSCNPAGARPQTREYATPYVYPQLSQTTGVQAAAWIPTWEHSSHASNVLSADGSRLFFNSNDPLLPRDANGAQDVYQWERPGSGDCDVTDAHYFAANGGCLSLISTGESAEEAEFWEAGADGSDVFFTTSQSLVAEDPGLVDLYDARVGGGFAPPVEPAVCEGEACQNVPAPPARQTPGSATYRGPGNPPAAGRCGVAARQAAKLSRRAKRLRRG
ncbi:MAG TPA: hypothetical protein VFT19_06785, partial [Solirubrobacterales bacterium]|nr:hypothetical protein [Solirubrobacterales bacterium]